MNLQYTAIAVDLLLYTISNYDNYKICVTDVLFIGLLMWCTYREKG